MRKSQIFLLILSGLAIFSCNPGGSRHDHPTTDKTDYAILSLSELDSLVGKKPCATGLWIMPEVEYYMTKMMGDDKYMEFLYLMQDASPLKKDRVVYSMGVLPDDAVQALGIVMFDTNLNRVYVELVYPGIREIFTSSESFSFLPAEVMSRRSAFGIEHPEMIAREYPIHYSGKTNESLYKGKRLNLHLDPIQKKYILYKSEIDGYGEFIRKEIGNYNETGNKDHEILILQSSGVTSHEYRFQKHQNALLLVDEIELGSSTIREINLIRR